MVQDPLLTGVSDGPKTPVSPRARSATLKASDREKKIGHRRVGEGGVTYKKVIFIYCGIFIFSFHNMTQLYTDSYIPNYGFYTTWNQSCCWWPSF